VLYSNVGKRLSWPILSKTREAAIVLVINSVLGKFQTDTSTCLSVGLPLLKPVLFFLHIPFELQLRPQFVIYKIREEMKCQTIDRWKKLEDKKNDTAEIGLYELNQKQSTVVIQATYET
jgi:hypothetical protein